MMPEVRLDFSQFGPPPEPPHLKAAMDELDKAHIAHMRWTFAQVNFFAAVLCTCTRWFTFGSLDVVPQEGCVVHGHGVMDGKTGAVLLFGIPKRW